MFATISGCSSDSDSSTSTPTPCPQGYNGTNCNTQITPSKILITKIRVKLFPNVDSSGNNWDLGGLPDIYPSLSIINGPSSTIIYNGEMYFQDVTSTGSNYFDFIPTNPIEITQVNSSYVLSLLDYDGSLSNYNFMGTVAFYPYQSNNNFPTTITITDNSIPLRYELTLSYIW